MWVLWLACLVVSAGPSRGAGQPAQQQPLYQPSPPAVGQLETYHGHTEYCETDDFAPSCGEDEVIVITHAEYGRMEVNKCVKVTYGYLGCYAKVLPVLDRLCSGRRSCSVRLPHQEMDAMCPCPAEFKTYLNASYMCVKVQTKPCRICFKLHYAHVRVERAYIASSVTSHNCGTITCPWRIELQPGQRVNITLFDFAPKRSDKECFRYAVIKETRGPPEGTPVCGGKQREKQVYTSLGHVVEIHIVSPEVYNNNGQFLFQYQAVGCPDITPPKNSWMRKEEGQVVIGCDTTHATWNLKCDGTKWQGEIGSCPQDHTSRGRDKSKVVSLPLGVLVAIVIGIALVIGVLILTVGIVCLKRQQTQYDTRHRQGTTLYLRAPQEVDVPDQAVAETCTLPLKETCPAGPSGKQHRRHGRTSSAQQQLLLQQRENLYARRMESRPLPSLPNLAAETDEAPDCRLKVQVHRTNSGRKPGTRNGPGPGPSGSRDCPDPQYFELDPDELKASGCRAHARHAARAANARASSPSRRKGGGGHRQKSPEEENAENCDKEVHHNNSCSEIPLRLIRDSARPPAPRTEPAPANNYSWP